MFNFISKKRHHAEKKLVVGYTLIEALVVLLLFTGLFMTMLAVFQFSISNLQNAKAKLVAIELANAQMEILRNIDYTELGTVGGSPQGAIPQTKEITRSDVEFTVNTTIKYYDDPFDGCAGEADGLPEDEWSKCADGTVVNKPRDIPAYQNNPADYKKCLVEVSWDENFVGEPLKLATTIAPPDLEGDTDKGFLLLEVIDANGAPVLDTTIQVTNTVVDPNVDITMTTDVNGQLLLLDLEPSQQTYVVKVSKDGYTTDRTCGEQADGTACTDSEGVPDPYRPHVSVHQGELEEATFIIDQFSTLSVNSYDEHCGSIGGIEFTLQGLDKVISVDPEILKNEVTLTTDAGQTPHWSTDALEWDRYNLLVNTAGYDIAGVNHDLALSVLPNTSTTVNVLLAPHTANAILVTAKDSGTMISLSDATIRVVSGDQSYDETKLTGQGFVEQTDWSGGNGQADFLDETRYFSDNNNLEVTGTTGQVTLVNLGIPSSLNEDFSTANYKDGGNTTADWNVADQELKLATHIGKYPIGEMEYVQTKKINGLNGQIATATLTATTQLNGKTVRYYLSADGGTNFEEVTLPMGAPHVFTNPGDDVRVRFELETDDEDVTPVIQDFELTYSLEYYATLGELVSSTFDLGAIAETLSDFTTISWQPASQPAETGETSVRLQLATNIDNSTWNFIGPDGTDSTYYTGGTADLHDSHNGDRYVRYKLLLSTEDEYFTPTVTDVRIGYTLECLPPGQAFFPSANSGSHVVEVHLEGYEDTNATIDISGYTTTEILLTPIQ